MALYPDVCMFCALPYSNPGNMVLMQCSASFGWQMAVSLGPWERVGCETEKRTVSVLIPSKRGASIALTAQVQEAIAETVDEVEGGFLGSRDDKQSEANLATL